MILEAVVTIILLGIIVLVAILVLFSTLFIVTISPVLILIYAIVEIIKQELSYAKKGRRDS
jgi:hypothetical protein